MPRFAHLLVAAALLSAAVALARDEKDPIKEKLFAAKVAYDKDMKAARKAVNDWFDKREDAARKAGDKKGIDQSKEERKAFDEQGVLPKGAPAAMQKQSTAARKALETAYADAVKAYTKAKKDDLAATAERELDEFRKGAREAWAAKFPPGAYAQTYDEGTRTTFELRNDGTFTRVREGVKSVGNVAFTDGKLILKCEHFVEVWSSAGGEIKIEHWSPPGNYPAAKVSAKGTATPVKE